MRSTRRHKKYVRSRPTMRKPSPLCLFGTPRPWAHNGEPCLVDGHSISPTCCALPFRLCRLHNDAASLFPVGQNLPILQVRIFGG